ncbi:ribonuclease R [Nitzschia inconspicua]|uniref:Ribosomal RNA-processing protein 44 n=1 Tax=Nitzschia inconspicua TaxID=303405 RepID=A0A9K3PIQ6_9STRA|nr:ribonuclease R [Nitzschia inconspicua]
MQYEDHDSESDRENYESSIVTAPSLYLRPGYFRQTRKGKIVKSLSERYLRDDLGLGCYYVDEDSNKKNRRVKEATNAVPRTIEDATQLVTLLKPCNCNAVVVCDTNVLLHNLDVLEQSASQMPNLVFPQTALVECRANRRVAYDRSVELMRQVGGDRLCVFFPDVHHSQTAHVVKDDNALINDENDARIRNVAALLGEQLRHSRYKVILLTDDKGSRAKADSCSDYEARSVRSWVQELDRLHPESSLSDLVAQHGGPAAIGGKGTVTNDIFPHHVGQADLSLGVKIGRYYRGVLRSKDPQSAFVTIRRGEERVAVTIEGSQDRNRAIDGDVVAVELHTLDKWLSSSMNANDPKEDGFTIKKDSVVGIADETAEPSLNELSNVPESITVNDAAKALKPTGKIVGILRRNFASYSGSIFDKPSSSSSELSEREKIAMDNERDHPDGTSTCVFFPVDNKVPPILIRTSQRESFLGQRIVCAMDSWPAHSLYPLGHYVETIGPAGSKDVETKVLLQQFKIAHEPFSAAVLACLPPNDYKIEMVPDRTDLRHLPVLSIDPPGCKDIDDALHCIVLPNGNYQVGVSIADVTHYVSPGTAIDLEAANRSTSTYLVNKRLDMLPALLTTDLCSLKANVDRYAFSVLWEVTPNAEIVNVDFKKSVIHSIAALTYQQAQSFIDQPDNDDGDPKVGAVKRLASLARKFREKRIEAGALTLASPEVKFVLDSESLNPTDVQAYALLEANALVEEFMLLANITVAKKILRHYPTLSVLRRHPSPNRAMFEGLISKASCRGFDIDIETSKRLADSLDASQIESEPFVNKLLRILSTRCMSPAQYFCSGEYRPMDWHHYGLAAPVYTHFTSPIRRYADVCVHRLLAAAINVAPLPPHLSSKSYLHDLCANMNRRHRAAQLAGRASVQLHTLIFFASGGKEEDAYVLDVDTAEKSEPSVSVMVPRYGIEGRIKLGLAADDPKLVRLADQHKIVYDNDVSIQVFDRIRVKIWVREVQDYQRELVIDLVSPSLTKSSKKRGLEDKQKADSIKSPSRKQARRKK